MGIYASKLDSGDEVGPYPRTNALYLILFG